MCIISNTNTFAIQLGLSADLNRIFLIQKYQFFLLYRISSQYPLQHCTQTGSQIYIDFQEENSEATDRKAEHREIADEMEQEDWECSNLQIRNRQFLDSFR